MLCDTANNDKSKNESEKLNNGAYCFSNECALNAMIILNSVNVH